MDSTSKNQIQGIESTALVLLNIESPDDFSDSEESLAMTIELHLRTVSVRL